MIKTIFIGILIYFVIKWILGMVSVFINKKRAPRTEPAKEMVKCSECSTYISKDSADIKNGKWSCTGGCSRQ